MRIAEQWKKEQFLAFNFQPSTYTSLLFFIPMGFAHGFAILSETAVLKY